MRGIRAIRELKEAEKRNFVILKILFLFQMIIVVWTKIVTIYCLLDWIDLRMKRQYYQKIFSGLENMKGQKGC